MNESGVLQGLTQEEQDMARDEYIDAIMHGEDDEYQLAEHWYRSFPSPSHHFLILHAHASLAIHSASWHI